MITAVFSLIMWVVQAYVWILLIACLFSVLFGFGIVDWRNRTLWAVYEFLQKLTEPVLSQVRRVVPPFGGLDLSPLIVLLAIQYLLMPFIRYLYIAILTGSTRVFFQ
ncbi:YggT family protein [Entomobacter blattae]|uniref:YGGT family protein n=1 Tax=Entomobacter blattae TaxID=2762277 RepID=A0A7H1NPR9_9PROT|nr:YggT family protein [Entomobacter blattae]QNT77779.1 YGGT family protein [Entomobacter blattae]